MARYIDLDKYVKFETDTMAYDMCSSINNDYCQLHDCVECFYDNFNGAEDVRPVIHAKWELKCGDSIFNTIVCSNCLSSMQMSNTKFPKYCSNCGAIMDLKE
ncbi:MAG: hypothetical protein MJZ37_06370 [Bacilli bacterium]|nr:hypothetical protein [Bacilli bacterium]